MDGSIQSRITAVVLGLAAEIERELISARTKEALAKRKAEGMKLGRPRGQAQKLALDSKADEIKKVLSKREVFDNIMDSNPAFKKMVSVFNLALT